MLNTPLDSVTGSLRRPGVSEATSATGDLQAKVSGRGVLVWCSAGHPAGGMERIAISIANGLADRGWRVVLVGPFQSAPVLRDAISPEVEFLDHRPGKSALGNFKTMRFLQQIVRQRGIDVISAHGSLFPLMFTRTPVVWTEHDMRYGGSMLTGLRGFLWRWIRFKVNQKRWHVVTVSRHVQSCLRENLRTTGLPGKVIYNGLPNAEVLRSMPPPRMVAPFQIGFLGRLAPVKYPLDIFELSTTLNRMGIAHDWNVFGDGELMPQMRARASQPSGHSVRLWGLASKPEDAFAHMDVLCFLSRGEQEGLGMVLLEAMAANRHIVAWDIGCIGEVLAGKGTLVPAPPFSLPRLAEAIATSLRDGASRVREFDDRWEEARMIDDYDTAFTGVIQARSRGAHSRDKGR